MLDPSWNSTMHQIEMVRAAARARELGTAARNWHAARFGVPPARDDRTIHDKTNEAWDGAWDSLRAHCAVEDGMPRKDYDTLWGEFLAAWFGEPSPTASSGT